MQLTPEIKKIEKQIEKLNEKINLAKLKQNKILIGIISCLKYSDKIDSIRKTWARDLQQANIPYFFIVGDPTAKTAYQENDILVIPVEDNYESLPKKVALLYEYIFNNTDYDYIYKIDDDCFLNVNSLHKSTFWKYDYSGQIIGLDASGILPDWHFGKCEDPKLNSTPYWGKYEGPWCGGGYGYFLSRKAMEVIKDNKKYLFEELYEDKAVGDVLRKNNILPNQSKNYLPLNPFEFNINVNKNKQFTTLVDHRLGEKLFDYTLVMEIRTSEVMQHIYDLFIDPTLLIKRNNSSLNDIEDKEYKIKNLISEIERMKYELEENKRSNKILEKEIENQKIQIQWYKDTYANRNLTGLIKDKIFKKNKK